MKRILVINSDPDTMELLHDLLQINGYMVHFNAAREEVPTILKAFEPDLVLLDISRQEELDEVHEEADDVGIPVLLMTGHNMYPHAKEKGFKHFINKPFMMDELLEKIQSIIPW